MSRRPGKPVPPPRGRFWVAPGGRPGGWAFATFGGFGIAVGGFCALGTAASDPTGAAIAIILGCLGLLVGFVTLVAYFNPRR
jgi:hypothetical protein